MKQKSLICSALSHQGNLASIFHVGPDEALKSHLGPPLSCEDAAALSIQGITKWCRL
jgi:hypothetical protein